MNKQSKTLFGTVMLCAGALPLGAGAFAVASSGVVTPPMVPTAPAVPTNVYLTSSTFDGTYANIAYQDSGQSVSNISTWSLDSGLINGDVSTVPLEIVQTVSVSAAADGYIFYLPNFYSELPPPPGFTPGPVINAGPAAYDPNSLSGFQWGDGGYGWLKIAPGGTLNTSGPGPSLVGTNTGPVQTGVDLGYLFGGPATGYGIVNVDGGTWNNSSTPLLVGWGSQGFVTVQNSGALNLNDTNLQIGQDSSGLSSTGTVPTGIGTSRSISLTHLAAGVGTVVVKSGGTITLTGSGGYIVVGDSYSSSGSSGSLYITGSGSMVSDSGHITVGYAGSNGTGLLAVENGGVLRTSTSSGSYGERIANGTSVGSGSGYAIVTGAGSLWNSGSYIAMGLGGTASLVINDGGQVTSNGGYVSSAYDSTTGGLSAESSVLIDGVGSSWSVTGKEDIGENGIGAVTVQNHGSLSVSGQIILGDYATGNGTLLVQSDGVATSGDATLGNQAGATGSATVTGANTSWTVDGALTVGNSGTGALTVNSNGLLTTTGDLTFGSAAGSNGTGTVSDFGTQLIVDGELKVGDNGTGSLSIVNQGLVSLTGTLAIADSSGSIGTMDITGTGSELIGSGTTATIGGQGTGTLTVENGGMAVLAGSAISLGEKDGGTGTLTVEGNNSQLSAGSFTIGAQGTGTLSVLDQATVSTATSFSLGEQSTGVGTATIDNASLTDLGGLTIGGSGTGTVTIQNKGTLTVQGNSITLGELANSSGTLNIVGTGSTLVFSGDLTVGEAGGGDLELQNGGQFGGVSMTVGAGSGFGGASTGGSGTVDISGAGSSLSLSQDLTVGKYGQGTVALAGGGTLLDTGDVTLASLPGTSGTVTVSTGSVWTANGKLTIGSKGYGIVTVNQGSLLKSTGDSITVGKLGAGELTLTDSKTALTYTGDLIVGNQAAGTMNVDAGATATVTNSTGNVYVGETSGITGALTVTGGGSLLATNNFVVGGTSSKSGGYGNITVASGGAINAAQTMTMWKNASVNVTGGAITVGTSGSATPGGTLQVNSNGSLIAGGALTGNLVNNAGTIALGKGMPNSLQITGDFSQTGGTLKILVAGSTNFSQLNATGAVNISGGTVEFDFVNGFAPTKGQSFQFIDPPQSVLINNTGYDFTGLASGFTYSVTPDANGLVFNALSNGIATSSPVPEPAALWLMCLGAVGMVLTHRRRPMRPVSLTDAFAESPSSVFH